MMRRSPSARVSKVGKAKKQKAQLRKQKRFYSATANPLVTPELQQRVKYQPYLGKVMSAEQAVRENFALPKKVGEEWVQTTDRTLNIGSSGFTSVGYAKAIPAALCDLAAKEGFQGKAKYNIHVGASTGPEFDNNLAKHGLIARRYPYQLGKEVQGAINKGEIEFADQHLSSYVDRLASGFYDPTGTVDDKHIDVAIIEATEITPEGYIVPSLSVGASPELTYTAKKIIIEVNTLLPSCLGLHDITPYQPVGQRSPLHIKSTKDRVGEPFIRIDPSRVVAVVETRAYDNTSEVPEGDETSAAIAGHVVDFLDHEVRHGRLPRSLYPVQSGIGNIANKIIGGIKEGPFENVTCWSEVLQDTFLDFFDSGKLDAATATSIKLAPKGFQRLFADFDKYKSRIILRNQGVSNSPGLIRDLGIIALNTPVEFDIFGHVNSTHVGSGRMISGLGGSNDFIRHGSYSFFHAPSTRPTKTDPHGISTIVPKVTHVDSTEHDTQIFVSEQGLINTRGMSPKERARAIIATVAHPSYRDQLNDYLDTAIRVNTKKGSLHSPHLLDSVFDMHVNLDKNGSMRLDSKHWSGKY